MHIILSEVEVEPHVVPMATMDFPLLKPLTSPLLKDRIGFVP